MTSNYSPFVHRLAKFTVAWTVLLSLSFPQKPQGIEDPESEPLHVLRGRAEAPKSAAALHKAGVKFAFQSGTLTRPQDFVTNAARAIEAGLPKEEALKAMTIYPAEIFGVSEQLGSIERGCSWLRAPRPSDRGCRTV